MLPRLRTSQSRIRKCDLDYVPNVARPLEMDYAISNNFAFGGANACIVLARANRPVIPIPSVDRDRVVITGLGALTAAGCSLDAVWHAYAADRVATVVENGVRIGRVNLDPGAYLSPRDRRRMDRMGIFAVVASKMALEDAELPVTEANRERIGCVFGTGIGPMESMEKFTRPLLEEGPTAANPAVFPNTVYNAAAGQVAMNVGIVGAASTVTAGHAAGASSISYGYDLAACNHADAIVAVAVDTLTDTVVDAYRELGLLSPEGAFSLAEAGVALNLERLSAARARGARIYGELLAYSVTSDAKGIGRVDPKGRGLEQAMRQAMKRSGLPLSAIVAVWATAVGHPVVDGAEAAAIRRVFDGRVRVFTPKRSFGEPMGAGASLNTVLALLGWQRGDVDRAPRGPVLVNSCSLGGTNFSLVLAPYTD